MIYSTLFLTRFKGNKTITTYNPRKELFDEYLDRTIFESDPLSPPKLCCDRLQINAPNNTDCNGVYFKTPQTKNGRVLYKQNTATLANYLYYHFDRVSQFCIGPDPNKECTLDHQIARNIDEDDICPHLVETYNKVSFKLMDQK